MRGGAIAGGRGEGGVRGGAIAGRGELTVVLAAGLVAFLLLVTADLDRPTRGLIRVPDKPLVDQLATMKLPPAAAAPNAP